jgi:hypothetical protein
MIILRGSLLYCICLNNKRRVLRRSRRL